ncbi:MAG TPA: peptidoglycan-binding protein [Syntrophomonadaceae bacterium]|nr:peptidoglycan-binding protein [Syntrophomonadaceae bacterium]HQA07977.1 peptidoglycan-binding protein [Syntrophomonadaceae bacterium]HQE23192.1 peptidoglycan-binding protein [Syntrophomonadaceae bacterium]
MVYASRYLRLMSEPMQGPDVALVQQILQEANLYTGTITGVFNQACDQAVREFQKREGLKADGVVGVKTWSRLLTKSCCHIETPAILQNPSVSITVNLDKRRLYFSVPGLPTRTYPVAIGKSSTPTPLGNWTIVAKAVNPGGPFGVRWMRLSVPWGGYGIHGTNNPKSIGRAVSHGCIRLYNEDVIEIYDQTPIGTLVTIMGRAYSGRILRRGDRGSDVRFVQSILKELGYYRYKLDSYFGQKTEEAVIAFQTAEGILADGIVGPETLNALQQARDIKRGNVEP